jgi:hypothetical protein
MAKPQEEQENPFTGFEFEESAAAQSDAWLDFRLLLHVNFRILEANERTGILPGGKEQQEIVMRVQIDKTGEIYLASSGHAAVLNQMRRVIEAGQFPLHCTLRQSDKVKFGNKPFILGICIADGLDDDLVIPVKDTSETSGK